MLLPRGVHDMKDKRKEKEKKNGKHVMKIRKEKREWKGAQGLIVRPLPSS